MLQRLFVYGSLCPGRPNEHVLTAIGGTWEEGSVHGHLQPQGWGAAMGYPGLILDEAGDEINGYIFSSDNLADHWENLDQFEGKEYKRVLATVNTKDKWIVEAYTYVLNES